MWQAAQEFIERGIVGSRPGYGLYLMKGARLPPAEETKEHAAAQNLPIWLRTKNAIHKDISDGRFRDTDVFPTVKELCRSYNVSYPTIRKALNALTEEKLLQPEGSHLRVAGRRHTDRRQRIAFISRQYAEEAQGRLPHRHLRDLLIVDAECRRLNLHLSHVRIQVDDRKPFIASDPDGILTTSTGAQDILGIIIQPMTYEEFFGDVWPKVLRTAKPVAILKAHLNELSFLTGRRGPATAIMETGNNFEAGLAMGRYLVSRGHTQAAYFGYFRDSPWVQSRLEGLRKAFSDAGYPDAVDACLSEMRNEEESAGIVQGSPDERYYGRILNGHQGAAATGFECTIWRELLDHLPGAYDAAFVHQAIEHLCTQALKKRGPTVWVGASDQVALVCMSVLNRNGITRRQISVAGFDDTIRALQAGLTTYNFGEDAAIHRAVNYVLHPGAPGRPQASGVETVDGMIVERASVVTHKAA